MDCPNCQHKNRAAAKYCEDCGHLLQVICPNCGSSNRPEAKFCDNCGHKLGIGEKTPVEGLPTQSPISKFIPKELATKLESARISRAMEGERRVVTMLFCDVKGSTSAAEKLDPEDWAEIMNSAFEFMIRPIYHFEGTVARLMGDAILAFFGAPIAHEDDPQRAVLAGLEIVRGMQPYRAQVQQEWGIDFDVRVGINTGLVMVGAIGSDLRMEYTAMGDAINLAARMEQTAEPGTVQIAEDTYKLIAPLFDLKTLGGIPVKGKETPVPAYQVLGRKSMPGRTRGIVGLEAPLIGRGGEVEILNQAITSLTKGIGGIVYVIGEAGLGKSRLLREMETDVAHANLNIFWLETLSLSYETEQPYALFRRLVRRVIRARPDESPESMHQKISHLVDEAPQDERPTLQRVIESLFGLASNSGEPPLEGETFKGLLYTAMTSFWKRQAQMSPVVLVCDDLQWSDSASLGVLQHFYPLTDRIALLLLCALRPERDAPSWQAMQIAEREYPHRYKEIRLQPLDNDASGQLVDSLLRISDLPANLRQRIMEKSEGNPYFVEEVLRTLIDHGILVRDEDGTHWQTTGDATDLDIPSNLQTLLVARIDRLTEEARRTLQVASVVGRSFYYRVLRRLVDFAVEELDQYLLVLQRTQLIQEAARLPELEYLFRHALTQEAAYSTILLKQRRHFHLAVGEALEALFPDQREELASTLADHFSQGQDFEKALHYYTLAADGAFRLFALEEALINYEQALRLAESNLASNRQIIHLYRRHGRTLELLLRHDEALETYQALEELGKSLGDDVLRLAGMSALGTSYYLGKIDFENSRTYTEEALSLARRLGERAVESRCLWTLLVSLTWFNPQEALEYGELALEIASEIASQREATSEDREQLAFILVDLSLAYTINGQMKLASERALVAQRLFEDLSNLPMVTTAIERIAFVHSAEGKLELAEKTFAQGITIDQSIGNQGGVLSKHFNLLTQDIYPRLGDFSGFFAILETYKPTSARVSFQEDFQNIFYELYPVVAYVYLGALEQIWPLVDPLLQFLETGTPTFPPMLLSYAVIAHIRAGKLQTSKDLLEKCLAHYHIENYILTLTPNIYQARAELALAEGKFEEASALVETFLEKAHALNVRGYDPSKLLLKGRILREAGRPEESYTTYKEARNLATEQKARPALWQICAQLAEMETERGDLDAARSLKDQARATIDFIADHAGRDDLGTAFLGMPEVQRTLENGGEKRI
jgi:class 3 adenylate cyclase/tetratricopeptide (TPR) repeat protein